MLGTYWRKRLVGSFTLVGGVMALMLFMAFLSGCSSDKKSDEAEVTDEQTALPEDGEGFLLDTSAVADEKPVVAEKQEVAEKPKPKPKPEPKPEPKPVPKPEPKPEYIETVLLAENSALEVEMLTAKLSTETNKAGDSFRAMVLGPAEKGQPSPFPEGTMVEGEIAALDDGKADGAKAAIVLKFTKFLLPGEEAIPIEGYVITDSGDGVIQAGGKTGTVAKSAGIGAVAGGVLGAITGKKKTEDAAKGAGIGAVAGGVLGAVLHKDRVEIKSGNKMDIVLVTAVVQKKLKQ